MDINKFASDTDDKLLALEKECDERLSQEVDLDGTWKMDGTLKIASNDGDTDPQGQFRNRLILLAIRYSRLVVLSFGFQHAFGKAHSDQNPFFERVSALVSAYDLPADDAFCSATGRLCLF